MKTFEQRLAQLRNDLLTQGQRVQEMVARAVECSFAQDRDKARLVAEGDEVIDRVDVEIERACVPLLAMGVTDEHLIRSVLTVVKVNNEIERIADCAVNIAEAVLDYEEENLTIPPTFRVMANSVIGIVRDTVRALGDRDVQLAQQVLGFDDTVDRFKREIILDAQQRVAANEFHNRFAFHLIVITKSLERMADHCTNICEQVIYLESGMIVRHLPTGWSEPQRPQFGN